MELDKRDLDVAHEAWLDVMPNGFPDFWWCVEQIRNPLHPGILDHTQTYTGEIVLKILEARSA